jgi:hypothetical protein
MNQDFLPLLAIVIAGVITVAGQPGRFSPWETIIGIILTVLLFCINPMGFHAFFEKLAFSSVAGLCGTITLGCPIEMLLDKCPYFNYPSNECEEKESDKRHYFFFCLWLLLSFVAFVILSF